MLTQEQMEIVVPIWRRAGWQIEKLAQLTAEYVTPDLAEQIAPITAESLLVVCEQMDGLVTELEVNGALGGICQEWSLWLEQNKSLQPSVKKTILLVMQNLIGKPFDDDAYLAVAEFVSSIFESVNQSETVVVQPLEASSELSCDDEIPDGEEEAMSDMDTINHSMIHSALNNTLTAVMIVDRELIIQYVNQSTINLFKRHEQIFRSVWSNFRASEEWLLGQCIDQFHKDPSHQRKLLAKPENLPYRTDISVADLIIELNVTAIINSDGEYIGSTLEWNNVTEIRARELEVGRLSSAVAGMSTNLMMADVKGNIVFMNPAVKEMLSRRERQIQSVLPSFSVAKVVGTNFDSFHKNPAHQQNLLGNPDNLPYNSDIKVGGLEFNLNAIALRDVNGKHVGTAVQWIDTTEENDAQRQVEGLIAAAINGDLSKRIATDGYQGFMKKLGDGVNDLMNAIVQPMSESIQIIQALSNGDLTQLMNDAYDGQFKDLSNAINESMNNLKNMVLEIRSASSNVFSAAREIAQGNNDLSQRTETQASNLEETASAMEQLTTTVQQNAENASEATRLASGVMDRARNGGSVVTSAVEAMENINRSSKKISDIIGVIDEIAFQTNLLALNAAVEAARAGEQGRGFAVVAAEVRNLAQRSAAAAKEIKSLINDSVEAVGKGTKLVDETGSTFSALVESVQGVVTMISDIDAASKEQAAGINEISQAVAQMDEMTQQNAALVEEASASSRAMEDQAQALLEQVSFFNTGEEQQVADHRSGGKPKAAPQVKEGARVKSAPSRPSRRASDDEWEEF